jgi:REP element-mobilizing transposase RayT
MHFSPIGKYLCEELRRVSIHHPHINILQFVVMPNHFHAIVDVNNAARCVPTIDDRMTNGLKSSKRPLLSTFIGSLKSATTKYAMNVNWSLLGNPDIMIIIYVELKI